MATENGPGEDVSPIKNGDFNCHVSSPEGIAEIKTALLGLSTLYLQLLIFFVKINEYLSDSHEKCSNISSPSHISHTIPLHIMKNLPWKYQHQRIMFPSGPLNLPYVTPLVPHLSKASFKCTRLLPLLLHRTKRHDLNSASGTCDRKKTAETYHCEMGIF